LCDLLILTLGRLPRVILIVELCVGWRRDSLRVIRKRSEISRVVARAVATL